MKWNGWAAVPLIGLTVGACSLCMWMNAGHTRAFACQGARLCIWKRAALTERERRFENCVVSLPISTINRTIKQEFWNCSVTHWCVIKAAKNVTTRHQRWIYTHKKVSVSLTHLLPAGPLKEIQSAGKLSVTQQCIPVTQENSMPQDLSRCFFFIVH